MKPAFVWIRCSGVIVCAVWDVACVHRRLRWCVYVYEWFREIGACQDEEYGGEVAFVVCIPGVGRRSATRKRTAICEKNNRQFGGSLAVVCEEKTRWKSALRTELSRLAQ